MNILWILISCICLHLWNYVSCTVKSVNITGNDKVIEGNSIKLSCEGNCDNSSCIYEWKGVFLPTDISKPDLLLDKVNKSYRNMIYTCVVTDSGDNDKKENTTSFEVFYGPETVSVAVGSSLTVTEGENYGRHDVSCKASGCNPPCSIFKWTNGSNDISNTARLFPVDKDVKRDDAGSYTCSASNGKSKEKTAELSITVHYKPQIVKHIRSYNISKGDRLDIPLEIYALPTVTPNEISVKSDTGKNSFKVHELKDKDVDVIFHGKILRKQGQELVLSLLNVSEEDFTNYTISIGNSVGVVTADLTLYPEGPPDIPEFSTHDISQYSVSFKLVTGFFNGGGQTIVVQYTPNGRSEWSNGTTKYAGEKRNESLIAEVKGLDAETVYQFRAYAFNEYDRSNYTKVKTEKTSEEQDYTGAIVGGLIGGLMLLVIIAAFVVFLFKQRKKKKELDSGTYIERNTDLTLKMPTSPVYENNYLPDENMLKEENVCPVTPDQTSNIYENTNVKTGNEDKVNDTPYDIPPDREKTRYIPYDVPRSNHGPNQNSRSKPQLYDVPKQAEGIQKKQQLQKHMYDIPRSKKDLYHVPKSSKNVNMSNKVPSYQKTMYERDRAGQELYDIPTSHGPSIGGDTSNNGETMPPYLDLNSPNATLVEEAYVEVIPPKDKVRLAKQGTLGDDDYLDMNEVNKIKESPYVNAKNPSKQSGQLKKDSSEDKKDYQNVGKYKKSKPPPPVSKKPKSKPESKKTKKEDKPSLDNEEESKDYQNVAKYKRIEKEPRVESSDLYMTMSIEQNRKSATSLPDHHAPLPPDNTEEDYINLNL